MAPLTLSSPSPDLEPVEPSEDQSLSALTASDFARVMAGYLNSFVCMALLARVMLIRASGESAKVVIKVKRHQYGHALRVSLVRSNGEVEYFNRDGRDDRGEPVG